MINPVEVRAGFVAIPERPGLGIEIDEREAAKHPFQPEEMQRYFHPDGAIAEVLQAQWAQVRGIPEVPGGYYTSRYVDFAYKAVVLRAKNAREVLADYADVIDRELRSKREEFGLDTATDGKEETP